MIDNYKLNSKTRVIIKTHYPLEHNTLYEYVLRLEILKNQNIYHQRSQAVMNLAGIYILFSGISFLALVGFYI